MTRPTFALCALALLAACGKDSSPAPADAGAPATAPAPATATATGRTIEIKAISDEKGNRFDPSEVHAKPGDVLKFTLVSGVHNVSWPTEQNPSGTALPEPGEMLQLPGQTLEVPVRFGAGEYHWQCDPHAALGMVGELEVE